MNAGNEDELGHGGDDMLAAEYVLGVLPADERREAAARVEQDADFARLVDGWEDRLSPLNEFYPPVEAPAAVKQRLDERLFANPAPATAATPLGRGLAFWRGLAIVAVAGLIALGVWTAALFLEPSGVAPANRLVASLASDESDVRYLVVYDGDTGEISMSHVDGARAPERDFELWVIGGDEVLSLGVVPEGGTVHLPVTPELRRKIAAGAQFAITLEPLGGSPTGQATGPIVAAGDLRTI
ncbi:anti-sigma factor [Mesorhizobium sp. CAU 1732]|uniref:anti-sigma factor n=1 Tax=Mesorhizobium sp. CAU 1732 TaxID=3140358 RepID=UPI0032619AEB